MSSLEIDALENQLSSFRPSSALPSLLLLRLLTGEFTHRARGSGDGAAASIDIVRYIRALESFEQLRLNKLQIADVQQLHAVLLGRNAPSAWRSTSVTVRFNRPGSRLWLAGVPPGDVGARLADLQKLIIESLQLTPFERIALLHLELLRTHPFEDGNGRLARLLPAILLRNEFEARLYLGITRIMRGNFVRYNAAIRSQRDNAYEQWLHYFGGAITAELHAAERINKAVLALDDDERQSLVVVVEQHLSKMRKGDFPPPDSGTGRNLSKGCARILAALL